MSLSSLVGLIWVLLVSFVVRGWFPNHDLSWWVLVAGIVYVVLRLLEFFGVWGYTFKKHERPATTAQ